MRKTLILFVLASAIGAAWLTTLVDDGLGLDWAQRAVRNWEQYGFFQLHGKMVCNPGGFEVDTRPDYYPGHRPASMYPVFFCYHLFAILGLDFGFVFYYAVIAAIVLLSIWWLLGRTERAFWLAAIAVITPGYLRWQTQLDPNLTTVMFGFPFCAAVIELLGRPVLNWRQTALLLGLVLLYSAINWTTVFVHAMLFATLLVLPRVPWRHLFLYAGMTAAMAGSVLVASVASKLARGGASGPGLAQMFQGYGWGDAGYGVDLTTQTALLRLFTANLIGLLPVLVYLGWQWWLRRRRSPVGLLFLLPLLVPVVEVLGLRNYFGHHPWMSVNFFLLGIILAAVVWKDQAGAALAGGDTRLRLRVAGLAATFAYSFLVLAMGHMHAGRELAFAAFVRENTPRDTTIVIRRDTDPELAGLDHRLTDLFDRHLVVIPRLAETNLPDNLAKPVILTHAPGLPQKILTETMLTDNTYPILKIMLNWYVSHIAHRRVGDQLEIREQEYFLCRPDN